MLRLVLPKGSLERATMQLFEDADLGVNRASDVAFEYESSPRETTLLPRSSMQSRPVMPRSKRPSAT